MIPSIYLEYARVVGLYNNLYNSIERFSRGNYTRVTWYILCKIVAEIRVRRRLRCGRDGTLEEID